MKETSLADWADLIVKGYDDIVYYNRSELRGCYIHEYPGRNLLLSFENDKDIEASVVELLNTFDVDEDHLYGLVQGSLVESAQCRFCGRWDLKDKMIYHYTKMFYTCVEPDCRRLFYKSGEVNSHLPPNP